MPAPVNMRSLIHFSDADAVSKRGLQRKYTCEGSTGSPRSSLAITSGEALRIALLCT